KEAGLQRITVSLDALDNDIFQTMSDSKTTVDTVLASIDEADSVGLRPVKVNMVVRKGVNDHQILPMARYFKGSGHIIRFIEFTDVSDTVGLNLAEVVTGAESLNALGQE